MTNADDFVQRIKSKFHEYKVTDCIERSDKFEKGLLLGMDVIIEYVNERYDLKKKGVERRRKMWKPKTKRTQVACRQKRYSGRK